MIRASLVQALIYVFSYSETAPAAEAAPAETSTEPAAEAPKEEKVQCNLLPACS